MRGHEADGRRCIGLAVQTQNHQAFGRALRGEIAVGEPRRVIVQKGHRSLTIAGADGAVSFAQQVRLFGQ